MEHADDRGEDLTRNEIEYRDEFLGQNFYTKIDGRELAREAEEHELKQGRTQAKRFRDFMADSSVHGLPIARGTVRRYLQETQATVTQDVVAFPDGSSIERANPSQINTFDAPHPDSQDYRNFLPSYMTPEQQVAAETAREKRELAPETAKTFTRDAPMKRRVIVVASAFVIASATIASADILSIPAAIPDICGPMTGCLTFTNATFLSGIQQIQGMIQQIRMETTNLATAPTTLGNPQAFIGRVMSAGQTVNQMTKADVAANAVVNAAPANAALAAQANTDVANANGAQQNAKAANEDLSTINQTTQAQLDLAAEQQQQDAANRQAIVNAFKPPATVPPPEFM